MVTLYFSEKFLSGRSKEDNKMGIFYICQQISAFWSKNKKTKKKEENFDWTLVNTENLSV